MPRMGLGRASRCRTPRPQPGSGPATSRAGFRSPTSGPTKGASCSPGRSRATPQDVVAADAALKGRLPARKGEEGDFLIEALEARTGRVVGHVALSTGQGSFRMEHLIAAGNWLVMNDS